MATKEIKTAYIVFDNGDELDVEGGPVLEVAHALIQAAHSDLEIKLTDERKELFRQQANKAWHTAKGWPEKQAFIDLWIEKETEKYFAIERAKHAYNELVINLTKKV